MKTHVLLILLPLLCSFAQPLHAADPIEVSLVQLLANPKEYDGKVVIVTGFMKLEFEGDGIYLHEDDYRHSIFKNGFWLDVTEDMQKRRAELDQKYVLVEGTFDAKDTGHMGLWSGSIRKITRCLVMETRKTSANLTLPPFARDENKRMDSVRIELVQNPAPIPGSERAQCYSPGCSACRAGAWRRRESASEAPGNRPNTHPTISGSAGRAQGASIFPCFDFHLPFAHHAGQPVCVSCHPPCLINSTS